MIGSWHCGLATYAAMIGSWHCGLATYAAMIGSCELRLSAGTVGLGGWAEAASNYYAHCLPNEDAAGAQSYLNAGFELQPQIHLPDATPNCMPAANQN